MIFVSFLDATNRFSLCKFYFQLRENRFFLIFSFVVRQGLIAVSQKIYSVRQTKSSVGQNMPFKHAEC
jgi:hypothetical protein